MKNSVTENHTAWEAHYAIEISDFADRDAEAVAALKKLKGVLQVEMIAAKQQLQVHYDASQIDYQTITGVLQQAGFNLRDSWWQRRKAAWFQYLDENARSNAHAPPPACCNKPPK